jgi:hypothetical protein
MFRKRLLGDNIPSYHSTNTTSYIATGKSVAIGYKQYLEQLNNELISRIAVPIDRDEIQKALKVYMKAQKALNIYQRDANADWKAKKSKNPNLSREDWDSNYGDMGYSAFVRILIDDVSISYGLYKNKQASYPALNRVSTALYNLDNNPKEKISLPQSEDDLKYPDAWQSFSKTSLDIGMKWNDFFSIDSPSKVDILESSSTSSRYESSWSAGGSVSYGFFSVGGSGSGGHIEEHLRSGTQSVKFSFKRIVPATILRGTWFDEGLLAPYLSYVDKEEFWGKNGTLNLIPIMAILGRGLEVEIETSSAAYDAFQDWHRTSGNAGFSFGPWSVGGGANSSTSSSSVSNTSSGTKISFKDNSNQIYVISVVSQKMDDYLSSRAFALDLANTEMNTLLERSLEFESINPLVWKLVE